MVILSGKEKHIKTHNMKLNEQIKARSITSKASSACKINMGLVLGESDVQNSKSFIDYGAILDKKMQAGGGGTSSEESKETPNKAGQAIGAINPTDDSTGNESTTQPG